MIGSRLMCVLVDICAWTLENLVVLAGSMVVILCCLVLEVMSLCVNHMALNVLEMISGIGNDINDNNSNKVSE